MPVYGVCVGVGVQVNGLLAEESQVRMEGIDYMITIPLIMALSYTFITLFDLVFWLCSKLPNCSTNSVG